MFQIICCQQEPQYMNAIEINYDDIFWKDTIGRSSLRIYWMRAGQKSFKVPKKP